MIYNNSWTEQSEIKAGIYRIPTASGTSFELSLEGPIADFGGVIKDGVYYATRQIRYQEDTWNLVEGYEIETGEKVFSDMPSTNTVLAAGLDVDPLTGGIIGICYTENFQGFTVNTIEYSSFDGVHVNKLLDLAGDWSAFAVDSKGTFFGIKTTWSKVNGLDIADRSVLCQIDRNTGECTEIGNTGYAAQYTSAMTFDKKTDRLFYYVTPLYGKTKLTEIDVKTGAATVIAEFDNEIQMAGLFVPGLTAPAKAPGVPTDITYSFPNGSYSGTITFKAPATLADGTAGTGEVTVHVELNGFEKGSATGAYGEEMSIPLSFGTPGPKDLILYATNDAGTGPKVNVRNVYVGPDTPVSPDATLAYADGKMQLSWMPVTDGVNGGSVDPTKVTYDVVRYPDMKTVARDLRETHFSETITEPETGIAVYSYEVTAISGDFESEPASSNKVVVGALLPPFTDFSQFVEYPTLYGYTVVDANNDGFTWKVWQGTATISYNVNDKTVGGNDWMMLPPLKLKKGEAYELSFDAYGEQDYLTERLEVKMGTQATPEAMTTVIVPATDINCTVSGKQHFSKMLVPEADGRYFIGFHGISAPDMYELHVVNVTVAAATSSAAPAEVTDFSVKASTDGALKADISFKAPLTGIDGSKLEKLSRIDVMRDGTVLKSFDNPTPGEQFSYQDQVAKMGTYTYGVIPFNEAGEGAPVFSTVFIGVDAPDAPESASIATTAEGEVTVTWTEVTTDCHNRPIDPSTVRYTLREISKGSEKIVAENISGTSFSYRAVPAGQQKFLQVAVYAVTDGGTAEEGTITEMIPAGTPYAGLHESGSITEHDWVTRRTSPDVNWTVASDDENISSQDGDGLYFTMQGQQEGDAAYLCSGLISLKDMNDPTLTFCTFNLIDPEHIDDNLLAVRVREQGGTYKEVLGNTVDKLCDGNPAWNRISVDLSEYAGKVIQIEFEGTVKTYTVIFLDNIRISQSMPNDLSAVSIEAPFTVKAGEEYQVLVTVSNEGTKTAEAYDVTLCEDGQAVETVHATGLLAGASRAFSFQRAMSALAENALELHAEVRYAGDANEANNRTETTKVTPVVSPLPRVDDLRASTADGAVNLVWSEPAAEEVPDSPVTQDFEDGISFAAQYGTWTFIDNDNSPVGGMLDIDGSLMEMPGITPEITKGSFWVWDNKAVDGVRANSGDKYLFSLFRWDNGQSDDWAISPALSGEAQTVTFYARSFNDLYPNTMEVYWSTGSLDPKDFVKLTSVGGPIPAKWNKYEAALPEGARRFAIRDYTEDGYMLLIDDVTFIPGSITDDAEIMGYNIYRDGKKVNTQTIEENSFADTGLTDGQTYTYAVTVVYTNGESGASNLCTVNYKGAGIEGIVTDGGIEIRAGINEIRISGAAGLPVAVVSPDGKTVYSQSVAADVTAIPVATGIYIVKAGNAVVRVIVE